jgi:hypothetical protein
VNGRGRIAWLAAGSLIGWLLAAPVSAQRPEGSPPLNRPEARDELFKMVDAYLVSNLQESLGLTDDQFVKLLPLVKRLQTERRGFLQRRGRAIGELRRALRSGAATEPRVGELLKELKSIEAEEPAAIKKNLDAIDAALSPLQQAKYRVLEVEVEMRLRQILNDARRQNRPGQGPRRQSP